MVHANKQIHGAWYIQLHGICYMQIKKYTVHGTYNVWYVVGVNINFIGKNL